MMISSTNCKYLLLLFLVISITCCKPKSKTMDVSYIPVEVELQRFDKEYFQADASNLKYLKAKNPYLFPENVPDSFWIVKKNDSLFQKLYKETQDVFGDFNEEHKAIEELFRNVKYFYPNFKEPKLVTLISDLDMESQVIYADTLLLVSLDTYLGENKEYYSNYPDYMQQNFDKEHILNDVAMAVAYETSARIPYRLFLERIIAAGKLKYAMRNFLPDKTEAAILDYSQTRLDWAQVNEESIWKYFIENEYLYSTDKELQRRFLEPAPFSKFYLQSDADSPGQIGVWLGYRIVQEYMKNNIVSLPEMMATPPIDIFNKSKYKPRR